MHSVLFLTCALAALALFGPTLAPNDPTAIDIPNRLASPGGSYPLGTDAMGRCVLSRLFHGATWSLGLAFITSMIALVAGTLVGLAAAMGGRWVDWALMRVTDSFLAFPELVAAVVIAGVLGASTWSLVFALSVTGWMRYARVARGVGLSLKSRGHVIQARLAGLSPGAIARWHYLPALAPSLIVVWTGMLARSILFISGLGFLGFGVQPPTPEWGTMLLDARVHLRSTPLLMIWPGLTIVVTILAINLTGDALRDSLAAEERAS